MYKIKEIYYTLQGEGAHAGRAAVFCRFTGCNLWTGREADRDKAICQFCDTDFIGMDGENGGKYSAEELADTILHIWGKNTDEKNNLFVVFTGGEPLLQLDKPLVAALKSNHFEIAIETNGTIELPCAVDWVCVSPKANTQLLLDTGDEIKLVFPQKNMHPADFEHLKFKHFFLQPMDSIDQSKNIHQTIQYCLKHPKWRLSMQMHKVVDIP